MYVAGSDLMYDSVKERNVVPDIGVEGQQRGTEIIVVYIVVEVAHSKALANMPGYRRNELVHRHGVRQSTRGLLHVVEVLADVTVVMTLVENMIEHTLRSGAFGRRVAVQKRLPSFCRVKPVCHIATLR